MLHYGLIPDITHAGDVIYGGNVTFMGYVTYTGNVTYAGNVTYTAMLHIWAFSCYCSLRTMELFYFVYLGGQKQKI